MSPPTAAQIEAMVSLLTDENESVVEQCRAALLAAGPAAEAPLRARLTRARGDEHRLIRRVLADLTGDRIEAELLELLLGDDPDLERGSVLIGQLVDGGSAPLGVGPALDSLAEQLREALPVAREPAAVCDAIRRVLHTSHGLQGAPVETARLTDALLHGVTSHRRGMPLPLCMVWVLVARRVGLPVVAINMPGHMLVRYDEGDELLVLDPFHGGQPSELAFWRGFLVRQGLPPEALEQMDASDGEMLGRTLRNVYNLARRDGETALLARVERLLTALADVPAADGEAADAGAVDEQGDGED